MSQALSNQGAGPLDEEDGGSLSSAGHSSRGRRSRAARSQVSTAVSFEDARAAGSAIQPARSLDEESALSAAEADVAGPSRPAMRADSSRPANSQISTALPPPARREQYASSPKVHRTTSVVSHTAKASMGGAAVRGSTPASVYGQLSMPPKAEEDRQVSTGQEEQQRSGAAGGRRSSDQKGRGSTEAAAAHNPGSSQHLLMGHEHAAAALMLPGLLNSHAAAPSVGHAALANTQTFPLYAFQQLQTQSLAQALAVQQAAAAAAAAVAAATGVMPNSSAGDHATIPAGSASNAAALHAGTTADPMPASPMHYASGTQQLPLVHGFTPLANLLMSAPNANEALAAAFPSLSNHNHVLGNGGAGPSGMHGQPASNALYLPLGLPMHTASPHSHSHSAYGLAGPSHVPGALQGIMPPPTHGLVNMGLGELSAGAFMLHAGLGPGVPGANNGSGQNGVDGYGLQASVQAAGLAPSMHASAPGNGATHAAPAAVSGGAAASEAQGEGPAGQRGRSTLGFGYSGGLMQHGVMGNGSHVSNSVSLAQAASVMHAAASVHSGAAVPARSGSGGAASAMNPGQGQQGGNGAEPPAGASHCALPQGATISGAHTVREDAASNMGLPVGGLGVPPQDLAQSRMSLGVASASRPASSHPAFHNSSGYPGPHALQHLEHLDYQSHLQAAMSLMLQATSRIRGTAPGHQQQVSQQQGQPSTLQHQHQQQPLQQQGQLEQQQGQRSIKHVAAAPQPQHAQHLQGSVAAEAADVSDASGNGLAGGAGLGSSAAPEPAHATAGPSTHPRAHSNLAAQSALAAEGSHFPHSSNKQPDRRANSKVGSKNGSKEGDAANSAGGLGRSPRNPGLLEETLSHGGDARSRGSALPEAMGGAAASEMRPGHSHQWPRLQGRPPRGSVSPGRGELRAAALQDGGASCTQSHSHMQSNGPPSPSQAAAGGMQSHGWWEAGTAGHHQHPGDGDATGGPAAAPGSAVIGGTSQAQDMAAVGSAHRAMSDAQQDLLDQVHPAASVHATVVAEEVMSEADTDLSSMHQNARGRQRSNCNVGSNGAAAAEADMVRPASRSLRSRDASRNGREGSRDARDDEIVSHSQRFRGAGSAIPQAEASHPGASLAAGRPSGHAPGGGSEGRRIERAPTLPGPHDSSMAVATAGRSTRSGTISGGGQQATHSGTVDMLNDSQIANASESSGGSEEDAQDNGDRSGQGVNGPALGSGPLPAEAIAVGMDAAHQMAMAHTANKERAPGAELYSGHHQPAVSFNSNHNLPAHHMAPAASNAAGGGYGGLPAAARSISSNDKRCSTKAQQGSTGHRQLALAFGSTAAGAAASYRLPQPQQQQQQDLQEAAAECVQSANFDAEMEQQGSGMMEERGENQPPQPAVNSQHEHMATTSARERGERSGGSGQAAEAGSLPSSCKGERQGGGDGGASAALARPATALAYAALSSAGTGPALRLSTGTAGGHPAHLARYFASPDDTTKAAIMQPDADHCEEHCPEPEEGWPPMPRGAAGAAAGGGNLHHHHSILTTASQPSILHAGDAAGQGDAAQHAQHNMDPYAQQQGAQQTQQQQHQQLQTMSCSGMAPSLSGVVPQVTEMHGLFSPQVAATAAAAQAAAAAAAAAALPPGSMHLNYSQGPPGMQEEEVVQEHAPGAGISFCPPAPRPASAAMLMIGTDDGEEVGDPQHGPEDEEPQHAAEEGGEGVEAVAEAGVEAEGGAAPMDSRQEHAASIGRPGGRPTGEDGREGQGEAEEGQGEADAGNPGKEEGQDEAEAEPASAHGVPLGAASAAASPLCPAGSGGCHGSTWNDGSQYVQHQSDHVGHAHGHSIAHQHRHHAYQPGNPAADLAPGASALGEVEASELGEMEASGGPAVAEGGHVAGMHQGDEVSEGAQQPQPQRSQPEGYGSGHTLDPEIGSGHQQAPQPAQAQLMLPGGDGDGDDDLLDGEEQCGQTSEAQRLINDEPPQPQLTIVVNSQFEHPGGSAEADSQFHDGADANDADDELEGMVHGRHGGRHHPRHNLTSYAVPATSGTGGGPLHAHTHGHMHGGAADAPLQPQGLLPHVGHNHVGHSPPHAGHEGHNGPPVPNGRQGLMDAASLHRAAAGTQRRRAEKRKRGSQLGIASEGNGSVSGAGSQSN